MLNVDDTVPLADDGVWTTFDGSELLIAHSSNLRFQRTFTRLHQPHRKRIENGTLDPKIAKELMCKAMADGLLINWRKVTDSKGADVAYSPELAFKLLMNNHELREYVSEFAGNLSNFRAEAVEELGNDSASG